MKKLRALKFAVSPLLLAAMVVGSVQSSYAEAAPNDANLVADAVGYIIVGHEDAIRADAGTFYPTGKISEDTLVVIANPDGSLPGGLTEASLQFAVSQRGAAEGRGTVLPLTSEVTDGIVTPMDTGAYAANSAG